MSFQRLLFLGTGLLVLLPAFAMADFFAPDTGETQETEAVSDTTEAAVAQPVQEYIPYRDTIFSTAPGADQIFSGRTGYIHPFVSVGGYYTDNLFNTTDDEESDWVSVISPGLWLALPASRQPLVKINTTNSAPGGLEVSRFKTKHDRRFQGYALYRADIFELDDNDDQNHVNQQAEALLSYNMPGGLSVELLNIYKVDHDDYNTGDSGPEDLDKFHSNLLNAIVAYEVGPRLSLQADYSLYTLDYNSSENADSDRDDKVYSIYGFYRLTPKFTAFLQYEHVDTDYDDSDRSDSTEDNYYGGVRWRMTEKTQGHLKLGYGEKDYDHADESDNNEFLAEAQIDYRISPKTLMRFKAVRKTYATNLSGTRDVLSHRFYVTYQQKFRPKWLARARLEYVRDEYDGEINLGSKVGELTDDYYGARFEIGFAMRQWLNLSVGYAYKNRDSDADSREYSSNSVFVYLTAAL